MTSRKVAANGGELEATVETSALLKSMTRTETLLEVLGGNLKETNKKLDEMLVEARLSGATLAKHEEKIEQIQRHTQELSRQCDSVTAFVEQNRTVGDRLKAHGDQIDNLRLNSAKWDLWSSILAFAGSVAVGVLLKVLFNL